MRYSKLILMLSMIIFGACKQSRRNFYFDVEQLIKNEKYIAKQIIDSAQYYESIDSLEKSKKLYKLVLDSFPTHSSVIDVYNKLENINNAVENRELNDSRDIYPLNQLYFNTSNPVIQREASEKVKQILHKINDKEILSSYLNSQKTILHRDIAQSRYNELYDIDVSVSFRKALNSNRIHTAREFIQAYPTFTGIEKIHEKLIVLETDSILRSGPDLLPEIQKIRDENSNTTLSVENRSIYTLTVRVVGPEVFRMDLPAQKIESIELQSGQYKIALTVNSPRIRDKAGDKLINGLNSMTFNGTM